MKKIILALAVCITLQSYGQKDKTGELHEFFHSGIEAFNNHNLERFLNQFSPGIEMYTPTGWLRGKEEVRDRFAQTFKQFQKVRMEVENLRVRKITRRVYLVDFQWRVFPLGKGPAFHGVGTGAYLYKNGKWEEILEHETVTKTDPELMVRRGENSAE